MQKSEKSYKAKGNLLRRDGEKTGRRSKYFSDASQKRAVNARNTAERFLFVVGATYIYIGSNNKRESAGKYGKGLARLVTLLAVRPTAGKCQADSREQSGGQPVPLQYRHDYRKLCSSLP